MSDIDQFKLGELVGEMRGLRQNFETLSNVIEAGFDSTHERFNLGEKRLTVSEQRHDSIEKRHDDLYKSVSSIITLKSTIENRFKGALFVVVVAVLLLSVGVVSTVKTLVGVASGIKL